MPLMPLMPPMPPLACPPALSATLAPAQAPAPPASRGRGTAPECAARRAARRAATAAFTVLAACGVCGGCDAPAEQASRVQGRALLAQYQCTACHAIPEVPGPQGGMGPTLEAFGRRSYIAGHVPNGAAALQQWLQSPQAVVPGTPMLDLGVSAADARDMAAYLLSLQ